MEITAPCEQALLAAENLLDGYRALLQSVALCLFTQRRNFPGLPLDWAVRSDNAEGTQCLVAAGATLSKGLLELLKMPDYDAMANAVARGAAAQVVAR